MRERAVRRVAIGLLTCGALLGASPEALEAGERGTIEIQLLSGNGYQLGLEQRTIVTLLHSGPWRYGSSFLFIDITEPFSDHTRLYGEWYPRLSLAKLRGRAPGGGLVRDVSLAASVNATPGFRAYLAGITLHFNAPGFAFLKLDLMAYDNRAQNGITTIVTPSWDREIPLRRVRARFRGFIDLIGGEGDLEPQILAQPQLLIDLSPLFGHERHLWAGVEYQHWENKLGRAGVREAVVQLLLVCRL